MAKPINELKFKDGTTYGQRKRTFCEHTDVWFGSGDYYILCSCGKKWVLANTIDDVANPTDANLSKKQSSLSGEHRYAKEHNTRETT